MRRMNNNQTKIIELMREVHLIAFKEIERLNQRIAELESQDRVPIEKPIAKPQAVETDNPPPAAKQSVTEIMNEKQLAAYLNISVSTVRRWRLIRKEPPFLKIGADGSWLHARSRQEIIDAVHDNLRNLGLDSLQVVNLRLGGFAAPEDERLKSHSRRWRNLAAGARSAYRSQHSFSPPTGRGGGNHGDCLHSELLQCRPAQRRTIHRRSGSPRHCLRALLPARRVLAASVSSARRGI
jgi:hypothetical protein